MPNPQMFVEVVTTGAQAAVTVVGHGDDVGDAFGDDEDFVIVLNSSANSANTGITGVLEGTPVTNILAVNSAILSNTTTDGDILFAVSDGGTSKEFLFANGDTADLQIGHGMVTATLKTASGDLTLAPGGDVAITSAVDIQGGYANGGGAPYDGVVDAGGGGNWTTAQAGEEALGGADYTMLIKGGAYSTLTVDENYDVKIVVEPGATFSGAVVLSGNNTTLVLGAGCAMSGLITMSGDNCSLICENGVDLVGILLSGDKGFVNGGGWDTLSNGGTTNVGINITGDDCVVENVASQTTAGGTSNYSAVKAAGVRGVIKNVKIITGDIAGIESTSAATDLLIDGCYIADSDDEGMYLTGARTRVIGCHVLSAGGDGIGFKGTIDNSLVIGCIVQDHGGDAIEIDTDAENCVAVGNRVDGAINDNSGTSTVTGNDATAF